MSKKNHGFTLVELMVAIAIIGVLAAAVLVGLKSATTKGHTAGLKNSLSAIQTAIPNCCKKGINSLANGDGVGSDDICSSAIGVFYPTKEDLGADSVVYTGTDCNASASITVLLTGFSNGKCNANITIEEDKITYPTGC